MAKNIDFNDVSVKAKKYSGRILKVIKKVIKSGQYLNGQENKTFERKLKHFLGDGYVTTVASGHDALFFALSSLNLTPQDEVIFPVNSYPTIFSLSLTKAKPIACDVDDNGLIDVKKIAQKITKNTRAVIIVHLYGLICDIDEINKLIKGKNIILIEDCAQAFGGRYKKKPVGTWSDIGCFSFYPTKNLGTLGDGGAIWTKKNSYYQYFLEAKSYGEKDRYSSLFPAGHSRLPEIQAAILNLYFKDLKDSLVKRNKIANYYLEKITGEGLLKFLQPLNNKKDVRKEPASHLFVVNTEQRDKLKSYLQSKKIPAFIHYPYPIHLVPAFSYLGYNVGDFPMAEKLAKSILSLPFHPQMTKNEIDHIVSTIKNFYL